MILGVLGVINVAILVMIIMASNKRLETYKKRQIQAEAAKKASDERFLMLREELSSLKNKHTNQAKQLDDMRSVSKKRLKKEARKENLKDNLKEVSTMTELSANADLDLTVKTIKEQAESSYEEKLMKLKEQYENRIKKLETQLGQKKDRLEKAKAKGKEAVSVDLESLPEDAVLEIGRLIRRSENAEKMSSANRGKLQLAQERYSELQKRYFGVCRELAVASGQNIDTITDQEAQNKAEDILEASETSV